MYRGPARPPRSPGTPGRFPSPASCWGFPGPRSSYGASGHRGASPSGGGGAFSPGYSPGSHQASRALSPAGFGGASRGCGAQMWRRSERFQPGSPVSVHRFQNSDCPVEKYFSPSMLQDPWAGLQPVPVPDPRSPS